jgi:dihydrodipicolinate synthase/N-acetylneuraminate lyase
VKNPHLSGYLASALVPYDAKLGVNEREYVNHLKEISKAERLCAVYVNALVGEVFSLEPEERRRLLTLARQTVPRSIPIISGVIGHRMSEIVEAAHEAREAGADILEVMPPFDVLWLRRLMDMDDAPYQFFKELAREVKMPISIFKYQAERGLAYSNQTLVRIAEDIEHVVAMKTSCGTCADYYQVWNSLKGKLSVFVTGGDTVDMLGQMMIGSDGKTGAASYPFRLTENLPRQETFTWKSWRPSQITFLGRRCELHVPTERARLRPSSKKPL